MGKLTFPPNKKRSAPNTSRSAPQESITFPNSAISLHFLLRGLDLDYVDYVVVRVNLNKKRNVLSLLALQGVGVVDSILLVILVVGETLPVATDLSRHVLVGIRAGAGLSLAALILSTLALTVLTRLAPTLT